MFDKLRANAWKVGCLAALAALLGAGVFGGVQTYRLVKAGAQVATLERDIANATALAAEAQVAASEANRLREQELASRANAVAAAFERGKRYAQAAGDRTADELRTGERRFRELWQECEARPGAVPGDPAAVAEPAGATAGRADSAGRIVRAVEFDAQLIRCLQADALTVRGQDPGDLSQGCPAHDLDPSGSR